jgi:hypothetical protein
MYAYTARMDSTTMTMLVGAGLAVVPGWIGWVLGRASGRRGVPTAPASTLVCSCGHGYGTHEDERRCHGVDAGRRNGVQVLDPCPCRRYDGPEPLPRAWTPLELPAEPNRLG